MKIEGRCTIELHNADCLEAMRDYNDNEFDLAIVDVPYGINIIKSGRVGGDNVIRATDYGGKDWDKRAPLKEYFDELMRISSNQIIWGANHFISKIPYDSSCWIVWDKENSGNFADCELAWTSFRTSVRKFTFRWNGMLQGNMKYKERRIHPTQKPIVLYKWLLNNYAKPGDRILDTHGGSMSLAIACWDMQFDLVCYEIDKDYFEAAVKRIKEHTAQEKLFREVV